MLDTYCGLCCESCSYKQPCSCKGCKETLGNPFHGECPLAKCCVERGYEHCGECLEFPCSTLTQYSCDKEHGDTPCGARIERLRKIMS